MNKYDVSFDSMDIITAVAVAGGFWAHNWWPILLISFIYIFSPSLKENHDPK